MAFQGRTLHFTDPVGNPIELCSSMEVVDRRTQEFHTFRSGQPQRIDHHQLVTHDIQTATDFYSDLGFRLAEYTAADGTDGVWGTWLEVKGNTHDIVFTNGRGPRLYHLAYTVPDATSLIRAADVAGSLGFGDEIDRGPGRHGLSNALFPLPSGSRRSPGGAVQHPLPVHRPRNRSVNNAGTYQSQTPGTISAG